MKDYTVIYSQSSVEAFEKLVTEFLGAFDIPLRVSDLFSYGVFCHVNTYAHFNWCDKMDIPEDMEIPPFLLKPCANNSDVISYVYDTIKEAIDTGIRPEWMTYIEMNNTIDEYGRMPSTFLYIFPKEKKYEKLALRLFEYLYSPCKMTTMVEDLKFTCD